MDETTSIILFSVLGSAIAVLLTVTVVLSVAVLRLRTRVNQMQATGRIRVQKLRMSSDKNHAFRNPALTPDEELSKRGFSMYSGEDVESGRNPERQTGGLADNLAREIESRQKRNSNPLYLEENQQQRQAAAPPFLLQSIEEHKKNRTRGNPMANGRQSDTNPNFIY